MVSSEVQRYHHLTIHCDLGDTDINVQNISLYTC